MVGAAPDERATAGHRAEAAPEAAALQGVLPAYRREDHPAPAGAHGGHPPAAR